MSKPIPQTWEQKAEAAFKLFIKQSSFTLPFMAEDFAHWAKLNVSLEEPHHVNQWGPFIRKMWRDGLIKHFGYGHPVIRTASNKRVVCTWVRQF